MNSLTDNEIIKAKAHFEYGIKCDIFQEPVLSYAKTVLEAFDELSRQKAEIENYIKVAEYQQDLTLKKSFEIKELKAEIERLKAKRLEDGKLLNDRVQEAINSVSKANQKYVDALEKAFNDRTAELQTAKAEIKKLETRLDKRETELDRLTIYFDEAVNKKLEAAKAEARKEVIERLNKEMGWWEEPYGYYTRFISDGEFTDIIRKMENDAD